MTTSGDRQRIPGDLIPLHLALKALCILSFGIVRTYIWFVNRDTGERVRVGCTASRGKWGRL